MKIRIKGNSVRIRIGMSEIEQFAAKGHIDEITAFGNGVQLSYSLQKSDGEHLSATFENNCITLKMPYHIADEWTSTDAVGFDGRMPIGNNETLYLLVEKDWKCLDTTNEDQSDMFANPNESCG